MRTITPCACALVALALGACGSSVSTSSFKGEEHEVAQGIANLQSDATAGEQKKVCERDLARAVVTRLGGAKGCESALKEQLAQIDNLQVEVKSIKITGSSATATVHSTYSGKPTDSRLALVKEGGKWKVSGL
jgi:hypothetical protein